ncbi:MAG: DegT/DnrJ/EryC1/StrS family aminotransferase [Candidatus Paceibacterota bacterium]
MPITIYPYNKKIRPQKSNVKKTLEYFFNSPLSIFSSGRFALLEALKLSKLSRCDHILIPDFLSQCVLSILNQTSFPVKTPDLKTKAVLILHQWGYPQDMDSVILESKKRQLLIIEDCAHSFDSKYKGKNIGSFGNFSIFSFSKIFPTGMGGFLKVSGQNLKPFHQKENFLKKVFSDWCARKALRAYRGHPSSTATEICYSQYHTFYSTPQKSLNLFPPSLESLQSDLKKRKENYNFLKKNILPEFLIPDHDPNIDPNPLALPIFAPEKKLSKMKNDLSRKNFDVEILHFDINRNLFNPLYKKCLAVPCHQYLSKKNLEDIVCAINNC